MLYSGRTTPKLPLPLGESDCHLIMDSWADPRQPPKTHLSHCRAHKRDQQTHHAIAMHATWSNDNDDVIVHFFTNFVRDQVTINTQCHQTASVVKVCYLLCYVSVTTDSDLDSDDLHSHK